MSNSEKSLVENFRDDPKILRLMEEGNLEKVAQLATAIGTAGGSPELRKYGRKLWEASQGASTRAKR